jgi:hypothetical protein
LSALPRVGEAISHPSSPGLEYQQKTRPKLGFNYLIYLSKIALEKPSKMALI